MEAKKSKKADLKRKRVLFFEIGMIASLAIVFAAFQWTSEEKLMAMNLGSELNVDLEEIWLPVRTEPKQLEKEEVKQKPVELGKNRLGVQFHVEEKNPDNQ